MGHVIAVASRKGGTGKTTLSMNLAAAAAQDPGTRVGALDLDPLGSLTEWAHKRTPDGGLASVTITRGNHPVTREGIARWASDFDVAVLDCPPQLGPTSRKAARVANTVVIPIEPSPLSLYTIEQMLQGLGDAPARRVVVLVKALTQLAVYRWAEGTLRANASKYGYELAPRPIVFRPALYTGLVHCGEAAVTMCPESAAATEIGELLDLALNRAARGTSKGRRLPRQAGSAASGRRA